MSENFTAVLEFEFQLLIFKMVDTLLVEGRGKSENCIRREKFDPEK